jgi:hypothetical protein
LVLICSKKKKQQQKQFQFKHYTYKAYVFFDEHLRYAGTPIDLYVNIEVLLFFTSASREKRLNNLYMFSQ